MGESQILMSSLNASSTFLVDNDVYGGVAPRIEKMRGAIALGRLSPQEAPLAFHLLQHNEQEALREQGDARLLYQKLRAITEETRPEFATGTFRSLPAILRQFGNKTTQTDLCPAMIRLKEISVAEQHTKYSVGLRNCLYQLEVVDGLRSLIEKAKVDAEYRTLPVFMALLLFTVNKTPITEFPDPTNLDDMTAELESVFGSGFNKLLQWLDCDKYGVIRGFSCDEIISLFTLIRDAHDQEVCYSSFSFMRTHRTSSVFFSGILESCESREDFFDAMSFMRWYLDLPVVEQDLFEPFAHLLPKNFGHLSAVIQEYHASLEREQIIKDIENLSDKSLLNRIVKEQLLPEIIKASQISKNIALFVKRLLNAQTTKEHEPIGLLKDLLLLTKLTTFNPYHEQFERIYQQQVYVDDEINSIAEDVISDILKCDPLLQQIAFSRILSSDIPPKSEGRMLLAALIRKLASSEPDLMTNLRCFYALIRLSRENKSNRVVTLAVASAIELILRFPENVHQDLWAFLNFGEVFQQLTKSPKTNQLSIANKKRALELLDTAWEHLSEEDRIHYHETIVQLGLDMGMNGDIAIIAFHFIASHQNGIPEIKLRETCGQVAIAKHIVEDGLMCGLTPDTVQDKTSKTRRMQMAETRKLARQTYNLLETHFNSEALDFLEITAEKKVGDNLIWTRVYAKNYCRNVGSLTQEECLKALIKIACELDPKKSFAFESGSLFRAMVEASSITDLKALIETETKRAQKFRRSDTITTTDYFKHQQRMLAIIASKAPELVSAGQILALSHVVSEKGKSNFTMLLASDLGYALQNPKYAKILDDVWQNLGLQYIQFSDGGNAFSTVPFFMETFLAKPDQAASPLSIDDLESVTREADLATFLQSHGVESAPKQLGRSFVYKLSDGRALVIKFARHEQTDTQLINELKWLQATRSLGLRSDLPEPITDDSGLALLLNLTNTGGLQTMAMNSDVIEKAPSIPGMERRQDEPGTRAQDINFNTAIAFIASQENRDYYRYLDDPTLSEDSFNKGIQDAVHDMFTLASHGVLHTAPIVLFHNAEASAVNRAYDRGRYIWAIDVFHYFRSRTGMGRLDNWQGAIQYANFGETGLRDFEELRSVETLIGPDSDALRELKPLLERPNGQSLLEAITLGNGMIGIALLIGNRLYHDAKERNAEKYFWKNPQWLNKYTHMLSQAFATAYAVRENIPVDQAEVILHERVDWHRFARQLAFFLTTAATDYLREGVSTDKFPVESLYEKGTTVVGGQEYGSKFGPYRANTFDYNRGFIGPDGDIEKQSIGPVNGQFSIKELERALWSLFLTRPEGFN
ncbi:MAG: hypothetical protein ABII18_09025 [bacterium]